MNFLANKRHLGDDLFTVFFKFFSGDGTEVFFSQELLCNIKNFMSKSIRSPLNLCIWLFNSLKLLTSF